MGKNKVGLQIKGLEEIIAGLEKADVDMKGAFEEALIEGKKVVTQKLTSDTVNGNFPHGGKYATGRMKQSIDKSMNVKWQGTTAELNVGYDFKISGTTSIFLMYGTPKMAKAQKLYNDIYGSRTKKQVIDAQEKALEKIIEGGM